MKRSLIVAVSILALGACGGNEPDPESQECFSAELARTLAHPPSMDDVLNAEVFEKCGYYPQGAGYGR